MDWCFKFGAYFVLSYYICISLIDSLRAYQNIVWISESVERRGRGMTAGVQFSTGVKGFSFH
jgi:hypothetical protein